MTNRISLYFHIPFCVKKCDYCAFFSKSGASTETKQAYFQALMRQIDDFETDKTVSTVYFGGGTPPLLGIDALCALVSAVKNKYMLSADAEITVEVNPGTVGKADFDKLYSAGVNRISVGIQSACDKTLAFLGRIHNFQTAKQCVRDAMEAGFTNISADVIFALPDQSFEEFDKTVSRIADLGVTHISAYSLQLEEGTPLYRKAESLVFPDEDEEEKQYTALCVNLAERGFTHYEISSFAKNGYESRHNLNYWSLGDYFGFGAAAHSYYMGKRFSAVCDIDEFIAKTRISAFAPTNFDDVEPVSVSETEEERIMLGLRTNRGVKIPKGKVRVAKRIAKLGYGDVTDGVLTLNSKGFRVSNQIISEILFS